MQLFLKSWNRLFLYGSGLVAICCAEFYKIRLHRISECEFNIINLLSHQAIIRGTNLT
jgi:hypothetical protein